MDTAPNSIAALFDLAAVGIEDSVISACARIARRFQHQRLIESDARMPIGQRAKFIRIQTCARGRRRGIEDQKIVAQALHL
jgi:hypothetical protein